MSDLGIGKKPVWSRLPDMSLFDTIMATAGLPAIRRVLGDEVTYTPEFGDPVSTWAIFSKISEYAGQYEDRLETRDVAKLPLRFPGRFS